MLPAVLLILVVLVAVEVLIIRSALNFQPEAEIIYAKTNIDKGTVITRDMIETRRVGVKYIHRLSVRNQQDILGKMASMDIQEGEMILSSKVGKEDLTRIEVLDKNKRLFSVGFNGDQANGWQLSPNQYVDIIFIPDDLMKGGNAVNGGQESLPKPGETDLRQIITLKNIRIAAIINEKGKLLEGFDYEANPRYISFELTEEQANFLAAAKGKGRLELAVIPLK